jgi:hypothetical protein
METGKIINLLQSRQTPTPVHHQNNFTSLVYPFPDEPAQDFKSMASLLDEFNHCDATECGHSPGTIKKYNFMSQNFCRYLAHQGLNSLSVQQYSMALLKRFVTWLPEHVKSCDQTHLSKHVHRINKAMDYAVQMGYLVHNPSKGYRIKRKRNKAVVSLDDREFQTWISAQWRQSIFQQGQELYIFQMLIGLSYVDLYNYKTLSDEHGLWIECTRSKTGKPYYLPLWIPELKAALDIHLKYNGKLPFIHNATYNRILREMAGILGITTYLTSHVGRKTFARIKRKQGWNDQSMATMMGITEKVLNGHYASPSKDNILAHMKRMTREVEQSSAHGINPKNPIP